MSLRTLRKLQERKKLETTNLNLDENDPRKTSDEEKNGTDKESNFSMKACNRFDLLVGGSHSESEAKEDDDLTEVAQDYVNRRNSIGCSTSISNAVLLNVSGARKKRKKRKKRNYGGKCPASSEDQMDFDMDEIEKSIKEVDEILGKAKNVELETNDTGVARMKMRGKDITPFDKGCIVAFHECGKLTCDISTTTEEKESKFLLRVEHKHLNPQNEMKRIFGAKVVQAHEVNKRRNQKRGPGGGRSGRGTWIVQGQPAWAQQPKPGLSMVLVESTPKYNLFKFQYSQAYQQAQFRFLEAVDSMNPDNILSLLHMEPFHVDTLLQVAEILRLADDFAMSAQLIERVIFVMESSTHPLFSVTSGNSRLNFRQQENRAFFIAIFRHILNLGMKGCYRTALELCKLLLNLSPEDDPMAVSLTLDFYAIRSQEYAWLVALYDLYEPSKNLSMLPNFSFSVPLALYHLSQPEEFKSRKDRGEKWKNYQVDLGTSEEIRERADDMLQRAIIMFPAVIKPLLDKCNVQPDFDLDSHPYFGDNAQTSMPKGLSQIVNLYIGRNFHVWKEAEVISWLEVNFKVCLDRIEKQDPLAAESEEKRRVRYQGTPTAIYRHILISEVKDATVSLPPLLANTPVMSYDPLPPHDSVCDYNIPQSPARPSSSSSNILASFFRGLLPSYDPNAPEDDQRRADDGGRREAARGEDDLEGAGAELRASVNTLLEAMRNLFSNIHLAEDTPAGNEDADRSEEDDDGAHSEDGHGSRRWD